MLERDIEQRRPGDLRLEWIQTCVAEGWVYVVVRGKRIIVSVTIVWDDPLTWGKQPRTPRVHPHAHGRSRLRRSRHRPSLLAWAEQLIADSVRQLARLDCVRTNGPLRDYYQRAGYTLCCYKKLPEAEWGYEAALYEKPLTS